MTCWLAHSVCRCLPCKARCIQPRSFEVDFPWCTETTTSLFRCRLGRHRPFQSSSRQEDRKRKDRKDWEDWGDWLEIMQCLLVQTSETVSETPAKGKPLPRIYTHRHFTLFYNNDQIIEVACGSLVLLAFCCSLRSALLYIYIHITIYLLYCIVLTSIDMYWPYRTLPLSVLSAAFLIDILLPGSSWCDLQGRHGAVESVANLRGSSIEFLVHSSLVPHQQRIQGKELSDRTKSPEDVKDYVAFFLLQDRTNRYLDPKFFEHKALCAASGLSRASQSVKQSNIWQSMGLSTYHQRIINRSSTDHRQIINRSSTNHQQISTVIICRGVEGSEAEHPSLAEHSSWFGARGRFIGFQLWTPLCFASSFVLLLLSFWWRPSSLSLRDWSLSDCCAFPLAQPWD